MSIDDAVCLCLTPLCDFKSVAYVKNVLLARFATPAHHVSTNRPDDPSKEVQ